MARTPDQEREEIKDGLRELVAQYVSLLNAALLASAKGQAVNTNTLDALIALSARERDLLVRRSVVDGTAPPVTPVVTTVPLSVIQARLEVEGAWDTYVTYMFGTAARRNAFMKVMFIGHAIEADDVPTRNSMIGAGLTQVQVDRIMAPM